MDPAKRLSRRSFLTRTAAVTGVGALSQVSTRLSTVAGEGPTIIPKDAVSGPGQAPASERLNIAGVGVGGIGLRDLKILEQHANVVALCDVDSKHAAKAFERWPKANRYTDYRVMLDRQKDIDGVLVATPDHSHAVISMEVMRRRKHLFTQKPLTHTIHEARVLADAAREYGVATQMGNQGQAEDSVRRLREIIWDGAIGPIREVHVWTDRPNKGLLGVFWPQGVQRPEETPRVPDTLDWDLWVGPAPMRPYHPDYVPFKWRGWWDFGTGALGDIGCHRFDPVFRNLKLAYPTSVQAASTLINNETYPSGSIVTYEFPARGDLPPVTLTWYDGGLRPPRPTELEDHVRLGANGVLYVGDRGKLLNDELLPKSLREQYQRPEPTIPSSPGHYLEWINACKGGPPAGSNFDWAGLLTEVVLMGNVALRPELRETLDQQRLLWDAKARKFSNLPEANEYLHRSYRTGWEL